MKKIILFILISTFIVLGIWLYTSPFIKNESTGLYELETSIIINAPKEKVFAYLGNSSNASEWSSFVHHITPTDPLEDGKVGSVRRCFKEEDESGIWWDELTTQVQTTPLMYRELSLYNLNYFPMTTSDLFTRQIYKSIHNNQTELTFGLYKEIDKTNIWDIIKMKFSGRTISDIFEKNLDNIKTLNEK
ncbi:MAG TPA: SRPBCC family protein [Saprospiraceae bacterium]|nr:SRPBCC family protein [Saprospiraceae bacterium]